MITDALTCRKSETLDDWYIIERRDHDGRSWLGPVPGVPGARQLCCSSRFGNADVEGTREEMLAIARAIKAGKAVFFERCGVGRCFAGVVDLCSPRNSGSDEEPVAFAVADALADEILATLAEAPEAP